MSLSPVLFIKANEDISINFRARLYDDFVEHEIILNSIFISYKNSDESLTLKFLELIESIIKRTINEIIPHKDLVLEYTVNSDDSILENSSQIELNIVNVVADDIPFKLDVQPMVFNALRQSNSSVELSFNKEIKKTIETPDIVLKKYKEMRG